MVQAVSKEEALDIDTRAVSHYCMAQMLFTLTLV
jgi:hypothetical protein